MLNREQWEEREKEIAELEKQLKELDERRKATAKKIHNLKVGLNQHNKSHKEQKVRTDTETYKMFGKPLRELTKEEYREYYNARQRINRQKRKEKVSSGGKIMKIEYLGNIYEHIADENGKAIFQNVNNDSYIEIDLVNCTEYRVLSN